MIWSRMPTEKERRFFKRWFVFKPRPTKTPAFSDIELTQRLLTQAKALGAFQFEDDAIKCVASASVRNSAAPVCYDGRR